MISLFNEYKNSGRITEALMIGRNMVNKSPDNLEYIDIYTDLLFSLAEKLPSINERKIFIDQLNVAITFFEENTKLTKDIINRIMLYREHLNKIILEIERLENKKIKEELAEIEIKNTKNIEELYKIRENFKSIKTQEEFDIILEKIATIDLNINHDYMTSEQKKHYNQLNKECTENISAKIHELEYIKNIEYNKNAVNAYNIAFQKFKIDENKYKNQTQLFQLVSSTLFAYEASRLFNETLIFYSHVYSFIFSKLDDEGKFFLTKYSIECQKKWRW
ncbi:hypothetical protein LDJ93_09235 [Fusobacterium nucleatum]|uniref:hypothetical protein n=1 Tax=Fusobacterium vincentii TaxID=155615 RepID=UPI00041A9B27|nr:hypothetical protein [Fusobacterium vincentii]ALF20341.1 hypothetical protein RN99_07635 [Fusobacterium vincentii ChDC F8]PIH01807.1 hypothetical protein CS399_05165 [Fusobacterium vincentii]